MAYDIFYVSKNTIDTNDWNQFRLKFPSAQKIDSVKSFDDIRKKAFTKLFWVVWDDLEITNSFNFDYQVPEWDQEYIHVWLNGTSYDGVVLFSKNSAPTQREFDYRFYTNKKEMSLIASNPKQFQRFTIDSYEDYLTASNTSQTDMFWGVWSNVNVINEKIFTTYFSHHNSYDRDENHVFKNICNDLESFVNGVVLFSKNKPVSKKEIEHKFLINKKEYDIVASKNQYPIYTIESYDSYIDICKTETQPMFWCVWPDIDVVDSTVFNLYFDPRDGRYDYDRSINHMFKNKVNSEESYISGISLCCPTNIVSKKEFEHRFFIDKKEHDQVVSNTRLYEKFVIDTFNDYKQALASSKTEMFWMLPPEVEPLDDFKFDLQFAHQNNYERSMNHVFKNKDIEEDKYNGIILLSKQSPISAREVEYRYLIEKKEYDIVASKLKLYDIVFISYNEPNADDNFAKLKEKFPRAKRIHGIKGIHQAHIAAAKLSTTPMFWVVDGDAVIEDSFKFDLLLPKHDTDIVHVWLSRNPINDLKYGYGGVKLLPKNLTENMDVNQIDMTMSISKKFKVVQQVSNITAFNTDPFSTWKSAFRECVKLASRPFDQGYQEETEDRLITWCNIGVDRLYGEYAIAGARAGKQYGSDYISEPDKLAKINDFEWLLEQFQNPSPLS